jgi:hypothetical protein
MYRCTAPLHVAGIVLILITAQGSIHDGEKMEITACECGIESLGTHELSFATGNTVILSWPR